MLIPLTRRAPAAPAAAAAPPAALAHASVDFDLVARYDRSGPRYTSYPPVPTWAGDVDADVYRRALREVGGSGEAVALYTHLPFCARRCLYCGCNATVTRRAEVVDVFLDRLERELDLLAPLLGRAPVAQLHWGGGTPNFLDERQLDRLAAMLDARFALLPHAERSVEADPRLATPAQLAQLRALGFSRISFGVQDVDPDVQHAIGRVQPEPLVRQVVADAREAGFEGVNVDLIYGLPAQTPEGFRRTLDAVVALRPDRIACFGYAHVPWLHRQQALMDESLLPDPPARFALFRLAVERFADAGYEWIGLDHFARADDPLAVAHRERRLHRNFMGYTTMPAAHLIGTGPSAIGDVAGRYVQHAAKLGDWQRLVDAGQLPVVRGHTLTPRDRRVRAAIMQLMCNLELPAAQLDLLAVDRTAFAPFVEDGLVALDDAGLRVTDTGRFLLRNIAMELDPQQHAGDGRFSRTV